MSRTITENFKSPERISHHLRSKPATPIEIPKGRRPVSSPINIPSGHPTSPDLIFEMSPLSPDFPLTTHSVSPTSDHEPFMYYAPLLQPHHSGNKARLRSAKSCQRITPPRNLPVVQAGGIQHIPHTLSRHSEDAYAFKPPSDCSDLKTTHSTTKITGFIPLIEHQPLVSDELPKPVRLLPPPPRQLSYSSPRILPGNDDVYEEDVSYSQTDPSVFEFRNHLLGRMENRDCSRFRSLHSCL